MYKCIFILLIFLNGNILAQKTTIIKFDELRSLIEGGDSKIQVINFWATWCGPCVKELPLFEALNAKNDPQIKVTLINLDYADQIEKVDAFIQRKKLKSEVLLLDEIDYNSWIDSVDKSWAGAIPATLFINQKTGKRKFMDKELSESDLQEVILSLKK